MNNLQSQEELKKLDIKKISLENIELSQETSNSLSSTSASVLSTIYWREWVLGNVFSILSWKKINPASLIDTLSTWRQEFRSKTQADDYFQEELQKAS